MKTNFNYYCITIGIALLLFSRICSAAKPPLLLANIYEPSRHNVEEYWASEKYDGIRAYWDGVHLKTRGGKTIKLPQELLIQLPSAHLDGELWAGRGGFETISGLARRNNSKPEEWQNIKYMIFDLPKSDAIFSKRIEEIKAIFRESQTANPNTFWQPAPQFKLESPKALQEKLHEVVAAGGEGLMLHKADSTYTGIRSDDLLKVKTHQDAEAKVIGIVPGKGKYKGLMGALIVEMDNNLTFKIGTGFNDSDRANPPPIGSQITFKYFGLTSKGIPRFASFLRIRAQD